ncbi:MAG: hypothetical protein GF388_09835 [Candidatus Aegiribacteria sp.]|nr:hypothetical protein [Candidatus Aegiribacteria sp.]MBD3295336.1 hypothetical protein [Candidatus Fermentibacteria bacterium]
MSIFKSKSAPNQVLLSLVITLLLILPKTGCSENATEGETSTLTDPEGYSLAVPPGWNTEQHFQEGSLIRADITRGDDMGVQVRLTQLSTQDFESTARAMIADYASDMSSHRGGCHEKGRDVPAAGDEAITARFRAGPDNGQKWYLQLSLVRHGSMLVMLQCGCRWEERQ